MFITKPRLGIYWEEVYRIIRVLSHHKDVNLVIKGHPRHGYDNIGNNIKNKENWALENDIPSASLLNWSDIVISVGGSSIDYSAIVRNLPLIEAEYVSASYSKVSSDIEECHMKSREEICNTVHSLLTENRTKIYSEQDRRGFIKSNIIGSTDDVLRGYANFILSLFD
jgi:hypothetical protein